jgi:hypothetical protein
MRKLGIGLVGFALVASAAASPSPASFRGIVVGAQKGTLLVTSSSGAVRAIPGHARIGTRVSISGGKLIVLGRAHRAVIRGVVVRCHGNLTFLSASHHMLVLHRSARRVSSARDSRPPPGSVVQATVSIDDQGELDEQDENVVGQEQEVEVQAVVTGVAAGSVTLTVNGQPVTIPLPSGLTLPASIVGTQVSLKLKFGAGTATVSPGDDDDDDDDEAVTTTTTRTTTTAPPTTTAPMMTTTVPMVTTTTSHHEDDHHGGDSRHRDDDD